MTPDSLAELVSAAEKAFTPGPWRIAPNSAWSTGTIESPTDGGWIEALQPTGRYLRAEDGTYYPEPPSHGDKVCSFTYPKGNRPTTGQGTPNAHLIAAAPDLYDACEKGALALMEAAKVFNVSGGRPQLADLMQLAELMLRHRDILLAALAKADGRKG